MRNPFRAIGNFFTKTIPSGAKSFFTKTIPQALGNIGASVGMGARMTGDTLSQVTNPTQKVLTNPLLLGIASLAAPEFAPALLTAAAASKVANAGAGALSAAGRGQKMNALEKGVNAGVTAKKNKFI
jgi:hypothetical protein